MLFRRAGDEQGRLLPADMFAGQTGVVLEGRHTERGEEIVLRLDAGEVITATDDSGIGFQAELDASRKLVGTSLWARGEQTIAPPVHVCEALFDKTGERIKLEDGQRLEVTRVEFGTHLQQIFLFVRTEDGREGIIDGYSGYLTRRGGIRPRSPKSLHSALHPEALADWEGQWQVLTRRVRPASADMAP